MTNSPIINTEKLTIGYRQAICKDINLSAYGGENICLIGKNGSGKSTFLKTIAGIINKIEGNILIQNQNILKLGGTNRAKLVCFVPSRLAYFSNIKIIELIMMGRAPYTNIFDKQSKEDIEKISEAIELFELQNLTNKYLYQVSDGERQKAMICKAFVQDTQLILMDEPSAFLDYPSKVSLMDNLNKLCKINKKTIIYSTHDLELGLKNADKIWICDDGKIIAYEKEKFKHNDILKSVFHYHEK